MLRGGKLFKLRDNGQLESTVKCPLTGRWMSDPVVLCCEGLSYEREDLTAYLEREGTSPQTKSPTVATRRRAVMVRNRSLGDFIQQLQSLRRAEGWSAIM